MMPKGTYKRTAETRKKISESRLGKPRGGNPENWKHSVETKKKMSESHKGKKKTEKWKSALQSAICEKCGKRFNFYRSATRPNTRRGRFCSPICRDVARKGTAWTDVRIEAQKKRNGGIRRKPIIMNGKEYSPNWPEIRKEIYKRDKYTCQECGVHCQDKRYKKNKIQCHHIDYDVDNMNKDNLITLCASCHAKTNFRRDDWQEYFKSIERKK